MALPQHGFVWLSMPKCASTAVEAVLEPEARLVLRGPIKHTNYRSFANRVRPVLGLHWDRSEYEVVCLFREPVSWLESWWRYRSRDSLRGKPQWTGEESFASWLGRYVEGDPALRVGALGRQSRFGALEGDELGIDRIFRYESPEVWQGWLSERMGRPLEFPQRNVSVSRSQSLDPGLRREAEAALAPEYDIYRHLDSGQWAPPEGYVPTPA